MRVTFNVFYINYIPFKVHIYVLLIYFFLLLDVKNVQIVPLDDYNDVNEFNNPRYGLYNNNIISNHKILCRYLYSNSVMKPYNKVCYYGHKIIIL